MASTNTEMRRILSRPLRLHWAGWETTTWELQKAGWKLSAYQDIRGSRLQLAFEHGNGGRKMQAITEVVRFDYEAMLGEYARRDLDGIVLRVQQVIGDQVIIHMMGKMEPLWGPIDAEPRITSDRIVRLEDLAHFAGPLIRTNEIIIPEESVPDLLERIIKMQQPARTDRIREELRGESRIEQRFHAQIISLKRTA